MPCQIVSRSCATSYVREAKYCKKKFEFQILHREMNLKDPFKIATREIEIMCFAIAK